MYKGPSRGPCIGTIYTHPSRVGGIEQLFPSLWYQSPMFTGAAPLFAPSWTPPAQPSQQPTWPGGWDQAALAQSFSAMGLTPPVSTEWIADPGTSFHTTLEASILSSVRPPHPSCHSFMMVRGLAFLSPPWVLLLVLFF